jgi:hypothetical protein
MGTQGQAFGQKTRQSRRVIPIWRQCILLFEGVNHNATLEGPLVNPLSTVHVKRLLAQASALPVDL